MRKVFRKNYVFLQMAQIRRATPLKAGARHSCSYRQNEVIFLAPDEEKQTSF